MITDWHEQAQKLGWEARELDTFQTLMGGSHRTVVVEQAERWTIQVCAHSVFHIEGIGRDGAVHTRAVPFERRYLWHRSPVPATIETPGDVQGDWCAIHGNLCAHSVSGCERSAEERVLTLEIGPYKVESGKSAIVPAPTNEVLHVAQRKARKKKKGVPLPGQLALSTRVLLAPELPTPTKCLPSEQAFSPPGSDGSEP